MQYWVRNALAQYHALTGSDYMAKQTKSQERSIRLQLSDFIYKEYSVSFLPKHFFINLDKVYKGTYKNLTKPVPVEDLLDMWQQKIDYLNKVAEQNRHKGKKIEGMARINYDLAILLSKYDSYCEWKARKDAEKQDLKQSMTSQTIKITNQIIPKSVAINNDSDISSIIDEI